MLRDHLPRVHAVYVIGAEHDDVVRLVVVDKGVAGWTIRSSSCPFARTTVLAITDGYLTAVVAGVASALLQGIAVCGHCGRKLAVFYQGRTKSTPGYYCTGTGQLVEGRGVRHLRVGGVGIDAAVTGAFLAALAPAGLQACLTAAEQLETGVDTALTQWRREVERARYQASKAERRYLAVDPDNRLVARGLEADWERALRTLTDADAELTRREAQRPKTLTPQEKTAILALGEDVAAVWDAATTTDRDRKELLRTLLDEAIISVDRAAKRAELTLRWRGGALSELAVALPRQAPPTIRTSEDTLALVRRLAVHQPDAAIAGILNRQGRTSARGQAFTASIVSSCRAVHPGGLRALVTPHPIPRHQQKRRIGHQIEQVVKPAIKIITSPTVQLGLDSQYPNLGAHQRQLRLVGIHQRNLLAFRYPHCRLASPLRPASGFPGPRRRVVTPATTTRPPPHPAAISR